MDNMTIEQRVEELEKKVEALRFTAHLETASAIVRSWPKWKRDVLGKQSPIDRAVDHIFTEVLLFANSESSEESCKKMIRDIIERVTTESSACDRTR